MQACCCCRRRCLATAWPHGGKCVCWAMNSRACAWLLMLLLAAWQMGQCA